MCGKEKKRNSRYFTEMTPKHSCQKAWKEAFRDHCWGSSDAVRGKRPFLLWFLPLGNVPFSYTFLINAQSYTKGMRLCCSLSSQLLTASNNSCICSAVQRQLHCYHVPMILSRVSVQVTGRNKPHASLWLCSQAN